MRRAGVRGPLLGRCRLQVARVQAFLDRCGHSEQGLEVAILVAQPAPVELVQLAARIPGEESVTLAGGVSLDHRRQLVARHLALEDRDHLLRGIRMTDAEVVDLAAAPLALRPVFGKDGNDQAGLLDRCLDLRREGLGRIDLVAVEPKLCPLGAAVGQLETQLIPKEGDPADGLVVVRRRLIVRARITDKHCSVRTLLCGRGRLRHHAAATDIGSETARPSLTASTSGRIFPAAACSRCQSSDCGCRLNSRKIGRFTKPAWRARVPSR